MEKEIILQVENLKQHFKVGKNKVVKAVDGVTFNIYKGETFGLVGESGSGKSTTGRSIIRLYDPTSGKIVFKGKDISSHLNKKEKLELASKMQMIFQDPFASVNPRMTVEDIIGEGISIHFPKKTRTERRKLIIELLETVGLSQDHLTRYAHEFSGGQLQRVGIARALVVNPDFIIADEAISALDVSIQAQVVNLMKKLQDELGVTYLFIAHDLSMVKYISDRIGVMFQGKLVELADADTIYNSPLHPYTQSLLTAIPHPDPISERTRVRKKYDPKEEHDYSKNKPEYIEVSPGHIILCTKEELEKWQK